MKLFYNCKVYASFNPLIIADAFIIEEGVVKSLLNKEEAKQYLRKGIEAYDLKGRIVIPGLIDAHVHLDGVGLSSIILDLKNVSSIEELIKIIKEEEKNFQKWIIGRGFDHEKFSEKRMPSRWDLDLASLEKPILIIRIDGHSGVLNSKALSLIEIKEGIFERNDKGELTGVIKENALDYALEKALESRTLKDEKMIIEVAQEEFLKHGITAVGFMSCSDLSFKALKSLDEEKKLKIRVSTYLTPEAFEKNVMYETQMLKLQGLKIFADGSFGSRTALLSEPYNDDPKNTGIEVTKLEDLIEYCHKAKERGIQLATHAIGDRALDNVLEAYSRCNAVDFRIEHASLVRDDQIPKLKRINPILVVQPRFTVSDFWIMERIGMNRIKYVYSFKTFIEEGLRVAISTDAPVEPIDPWLTINAAKNRGVLQKYSQNQSLNILETLDLYTRGSAVAIGRKDLGSLIQGRKADFLVLNKDPIEEGLEDIRVLKVFIEGKEIL